MFLFFNETLVVDQSFLLVFGIFLLAVGQTCLSREWRDLQEEVRVTVNPHGHQDRSDRVDCVSCQHQPEHVARDTERGCGAGMEGRPDVGPLALSEDTREQLFVHLEDNVQSILKV